MTSYQRYKADTTAFTTWLTQTAISCGYARVNIESVKLRQLSTSDLAPAPTPSAGVPAPIVSVGNRKERRNAAKRNEAARKAALKEATRKQAKSTPTTALSPDPQPKYFMIKTQELINQAKAVASTKYIVPDNVIRVLERAIIARKRCSAWFQETGDHNGQSTEGHLHFISVLETALQILAPDRLPIGKLSKNTFAKSVKASGGFGGLEDLSNKFSALEVEDTENILDNDPFPGESVMATDVPVNSSARTPPSKPTDIYELEHNDSVEHLFVVFCFFEDLIHTREFLRKTWVDYKNGDTHLATAAFITNSALELARKSEDDIMAILYPGDTKESKEACMVSYFRLSELLCNQSNLSDTWKEFVYYDTYTYLSATLRGEKQLGTPDDETETPLRLLWLEEIWESKNVLAQNVGFRDVYSQGRKQVRLDARLTSWMVFGTTVLLDIYALDIDNASITNELNDEMDSSFIRLQSKLGGSSSKPLLVIHGEKWWAEDQQPLRKMELTLFGLCSLVIGPTMSKNDPRKAPTDMQYFCRILHNPIFCGMKILELSVDREVAGIALANYHVSIFTMVHLYNAIRICSPEIAWDELEHVMKLHNRTLFGGELPTNFRDCVTRLILKHGCSLNSSTSQLRRGQIDPHGIDTQLRRGKHRKEYRPGFKYGALLSYNKNAAILKEYFAEEKSFEQTLFQVQKAMQEDFAKSCKQRLPILPAKQPSSIQQLTYLQNWISQVIEYLETDNLTLTRVINQFLRILVFSLNEAFPSHQPPYCSKKQTNSLEPGHLEMVISLLLEAELVEKMMEKKKSSEPFQSAQLVKAGQVLHQFIQDLKVRKAKSENGEILERLDSL